MSESLSGRAARGAALSLLGSTPANILSVLLTIACARWLTPGAFGAYSLAAAIFGISDMLTNPSANTYLVRQPDCSDRAIDSAWTLTAVRGAVLTALFFWLAPACSFAFGGTRETALLLELLSLRFLLTGLSNLHVVRLQHRLDYGRVALIESGGAVLGSLLAIGLLFVFRHPAALAFGQLGTALASTLASWLLAPRRARLRVDLEEIKTMWRFTRFLSLNAVIVYALLNLDDLIVARLAGTVALGVYALSYRIVNAAVLFILQPLGQILLPALSRVRSDAQRFGDAAARAVSAFACVSWFLTAGCAVLADELFALLAPGGDWSQGVAIFRALLPFVLARGVNSALGATILAAGHPSLLTKVSGLQLVFMVPAAWLGFALHGFVGLTAAVSLLNVCATLALLALAPAHAHVGGLRLLALVLLPLPAATLSALLGALLRPLAPTAALALLITIPALATAFVALWELTVRSLRRWLPDAPSLLELSRSAVRHAA